MKNKSVDFGLFLLWLSWWLFYILFIGWFRRYITPKKYYFDSVEELNDFRGKLFNKHLSSIIESIVTVGNLSSGVYIRRRANLFHATEEWRFETQRHIFIYDGGSDVQVFLK